MQIKKLIPAVVLSLTSFYCLGQDVNKLIQQNDVERIIKTLAADDMQGRATFTPGIEKAAQFRDRMKALKAGSVYEEASATRSGAGG